MALHERGAADAPDTAVVDRQHRRAGAERHQQMPRRQREAVSLRYFADLPEQEVAALMDVSVGSVKTHVHRGLASIRIDLGEGWATATS